MVVRRWGRAVGVTTQERDENRNVTRGQTAVLCVKNLKSARDRYNCRTFSDVLITDHRINPGAPINVGTIIQFMYV